MTQNELHIGGDILKRIDDRPISIDPQEILLFTIMRNEYDKLPYWFEYYRKLGINRFIIVDNNSTDGTGQYLCAQPDCHVFATTDNYAHHIDWFNGLLQNYGGENWCLTVDADELFVYPDSEQIDLMTFCAFLEQQSYNAVPSFLLDLYSDKDLHEVVYEAGRPFTECCPYFDKDYHFFMNQNFNIQHPFGGPRLRVFYPKWHQYLPHQWIDKTISFTNLFSYYLKRLGLEYLRTLISSPPHLYKTPLLKWNKDYVWHSHDLTHHNIKLANVTSALLHFKFFAGFYNQAMIESKRQQHYDGAIEYRQYHRICKKNPKLNFMYSGSMRYTGTTDLVQCNLIKTSLAYEDYRSNLNKNTPINQHDAK